MSHDLDSALRDSLRRHAESAPTVIDTDGIRLRAKKIQRRRTLESVAAAFVLLGVVVGLGAVIGSLRTDATPPPVTSGTATPTPTGSAPTTYSDLPWVASVIPYKNPGGANATQPSGGNKLVVTVAGKQTVVTDVGNAALTLVGWYGAGHRSLVYIAGQDVVNDLHRATFADDGSVESDEVLTIDGSSKGVATPLTTGGFAWVPSRPGTFPGKDEIVDYVDDSFQVVASRPAPAGAWLVTREVVVSRDGGTLTVTGDAASTTRKLPASCIDAPAQGPDGHGTTAVSPDGRVAALECGAHVVLVSLDPLSPSSVDELPDVPGGGSVIAAWFDPQSGLSASSSDDPRQTTSTSARTSVWNTTTLRWDTAYQQNVVTQVWSGDTAFSLYADKPGEDPDVQPPAWFSETTPHLQVSPTNATLESYGLTFAARTPVTTPSPTPTAVALPAAPASPPWSAVTRDYQPKNSPPLVGVMVNIGGHTRQVGDGANAQTEIAGWSGPDRRTLVWGYTQDYSGDQGILIATFDAEGSLVSGPTDLSLPKIPQVIGRPFVLPDGRLVVWRLPAVGGSGGTLLRFSEDMSSATSTELPAGDPVFATSKYVGLQPSSTSLLVVGAGGSGTRTLPECPGYSATVSQDEEFVAISCTGGTIEVLDLPTVSGDSGAAGGVTRLPAFPDKSNLVSTWFDPAGQLFASSTSSGGKIVTWSYGGDQGDTWTPTRQQGVVNRVYTGDGYAVALYADPSELLADAKPYTWLTETDPAIDLAVAGTDPGANQWISLRLSG